jgi:hypothetical protein
VFTSKQAGRLSAVRPIPSFTIRRAIRDLMLERFGIRKSPNNNKAQIAVKLRFNPRWNLGKLSNFQVED